MGRTPNGGVKAPFPKKTRSDERIRKMHDFLHSVLPGGAQPSRTPAPPLLLASAESNPHPLFLAGASRCQETLPRKRCLSICCVQNDGRRRSWLRARRHRCDPAQHVPHPCSCVACARFMCFRVVFVFQLSVRAREKAMSRSRLFGCVVT